MRWRGALLCVIVGSILVGWLAQPAAESAVGVAEFGGRCPPETKQWADGWLRTGGREVRRLYVLCRLDGRTHAVLVHRRSPQGDQILSWRPTATFIGELPPYGLDRVDIFNAAGQLVGYASRNRAGRHVDVYSAGSALVGSGELDPSSGRVEWFNQQKRRQESLVLPIPPG